MLYASNITKQWADRLVYGVRFDARHHHIEHLFGHPDLGDTVGDRVEVFTRQTVISMIERGTTFCTIFLENGRWTRGAMIHVIVVNGVKYLRTTPDRTPRDNLDHLPER